MRQEVVGNGGCIAHGRFREKAFAFSGILMKNVTVEALSRLRELIEEAEFERRVDAFDIEVDGDRVWVYVLLRGERAAGRHHEWCVRELKRHIQDSKTIRNPMLCRLSPDIIRAVLATHTAHTTMH